MDKVKNSLKKIWSWIKTYWYIFPMAIVFVVSMFMLKGNNSKLLQSILAKYRAQLVRHEQVVSEINEIHTEKALKQKKIESKYREIIALAETKYTLTVDTADEVREKDIKRILLRTEEDPAKMAREINMFFGVDIYEE